MGDMWNDNSAHNQVIRIAPFTLTNLYFNYTLGRGGIFRESKLRLSINNLFDNHNIVSVAQSAGGATYQPWPSDQIQVLPARGVTLTMSVGLSPRR